MRLCFVSKQAPGKKTRAALSVVMDHLLGLLSILCLAGLSVALRFSWFKQSGKALSVAYLALSLLAGGCAFVIFLFVAVGFGLLHKLPKRMPLCEQIFQSGEALNIYRTHYASMMAAFPSLSGRISPIISVTIVRRGRCIPQRRTRRVYLMCCRSCRW